MNAEKGCFIGCLGMIAGIGVVIVGIIAVIVLGAIAMDLGSDEDDTFGTACSEREKTSKKICMKLK